MLPSQNKKININNLGNNHYYIGLLNELNIDTFGDNEAVLHTL
jgi:hypothetical protein